MIFHERQVKGIIAICIILAVIPFFIYISNLSINYKIPQLADQIPDSISIEIIDGEQNRGLYFVSEDTSADALFKSTGMDYLIKKDFSLKDGMSIIINHSSGNQDISLAMIDPTKRLAIGMKLDINRATESDLILVNGIGEVTAKKILALREKLGRYKNIEQLTEIKGIKEKKLAKFRKYLCVEK